MQKLHCIIGEGGTNAAAGVPFEDRSESRLCPVCGVGTACSKRTPWNAAHGRKGFVHSNAKRLCRDLSGTAW